MGRIYIQKAVIFELHFLEIIRILQTTDSDQQENIRCPASAIEGKSELTDLRVFDKSEYEQQKEKLQDKNSEVKLCMIILDCWSLFWQPWITKICLTFQ